MFLRLHKRHELNMRPAAKSNIQSAEMSIKHTCACAMLAQNINQSSDLSIKMLFDSPSSGTQNMHCIFKVKYCIQCDPRNIILAILKNNNNTTF